MMPACILSVKHIEESCKALNLRPSKKMGQNFLVDERVLSDIIIAADLRKNDTVLEIGPGFGALTSELVKRTAGVVAVELDKKLAKYIKVNKLINKPERLKIIQGDIIQLLNCSIAELFYGVRYKVVANLPYQITSRVLGLLLAADNKPSQIVVMVQREVADRICATAGKMSVLSVMAQYYSTPEIIRFVSRNSSWPIPEVDSAIIKLKVRKLGSGKVAAKEFFKIVKIGFSSRRKKLKNNLASVFGKDKVADVFKALGLEENIRAQELDVATWMRLVHGF